MDLEAWNPIWNYSHNNFILLGSFKFKMPSFDDFSQQAEAITVRQKDRRLAHDSKADYYRLID